jgi:hypothetical protein
VDQYIQPVTKIYASFNDARNDIDKYGYSFLFDTRKKTLEIADLAQGARNLIVGEPGVGKTELLKKIKEHHDISGHKTRLINLRAGNVVDQIDAFLKEETYLLKVLILDALDEIRSAFFSDILQKIEMISKENPDLIIYLSSRWVFISKYSVTFPEFRFIKIMPFSQEQVKKYLVQAGNSSSDVDVLLAKIIHSNHDKFVVQIPRYLMLLAKYIDDKNIKNISSGISRNDLFEYFIYSKLGVEDNVLNTDTKMVIKRILEKLALTMEIYQTNIITKDELMSFFDGINSDLKLTVLSHVSLDIFYAKTTLQESVQDLDSIEFENTEFQEYLAAKEITRFAEPHRTVFSFAVDEKIGEIYPSWFNTLTFLVDMTPDILEQLLEFSGFRSIKFKIIDDGFLNFLSKVDPTKLSSDFRKRIFMDVINYHTKTSQWLPGDLADSLPSFFTTSLEVELKALAEKAERVGGTNRYIILGNVAYIVAYLLGAKILLDRLYWRERLISYTKDINENGVLQRHALFALQKLGDKTVIDELPNLLDAEDLVARVFVSTCSELNPDNQKSLEYVIESIKRNDPSSRYALFKIKERRSIVFFLNTYINDELFRKEFLDHTSIFGEKDSSMVANIIAVLNPEIEELCKDVIVKSVDSYAYRSIDKSDFVFSLIRLMKTRSPDFIPELLRRINNNDSSSNTLFFSEGIFAYILDKEDISIFLDTILSFNQSRIAMDTMVRIKYSNRDFSEDLYEAGRSKLPEEYSKYESSQAINKKSKSSSSSQIILKEFKKLLQPIKGKYSKGVFRYYIDNAEQLDSMPKNCKERLIKLITGSVLNQNPAIHGLIIESEHGDENGGTKTFTANEIAFIFGDAIRAAQRLGINVEPYRLNIALFIPFAHSDELEVIFNMIENFTLDELEPVVAIYRDKKTDLWRHQPESFIDLVQRYHLIEASSLLKNFVKEPLFRIYTRNKALQIAESIMPDAEFLREVFSLYVNNGNDKEKEIAHIANGLLITAHGAADAITWRLEKIKERAFSFIMPRSGEAHSIGPFENELQHDKPFAKPLLELKYLGSEKKYLDMLDSAIEVWGRGKEFEPYAQYMWNIVYSYFENLKEYKTYEPLKSLEERIVLLKDRDGANWLASGMSRLRRSYLSYIGRPKNFSEAIRKYNEAQNFGDKKITNSTELLQNIQDVIRTDLRRWVEYEGAYNIIVSKKKYKKNKEYEKLVQMTIKSEVSNICIGRGFKIDLAREEQLLSGKRTDFIVRYGFVGPIILELKLGSNSDIKMSNPEKSESYASMVDYMNGFGASHGIFLIMDDTGNKNILRASEIFAKIPNVSVIVLDCFTPATRKSKTKKVNHRLKK